MNVSFVAHALERLVERGLDSDMVIETVTRPQQVVDYEGRKVAQRRYIDRETSKEYLARIIFEEHQGERIVISAYRTSKIAKYWKE